MLLNCAVIQAPEMFAAGPATQRAPWPSSLAGPQSSPLVLGSQLLSMAQASIAASDLAVTAMWSEPLPPSHCDPQNILAPYSAGPALPPHPLLSPGPGQPFLPFPKEESFSQISTIIVKSQSIILKLALCLTSHFLRAHLTLVLIYLHALGTQ